MAGLPRWALAEVAAALADEPAPVAREALTLIERGEHTASYVHVERGVYALEVDAGPVLLLLAVPDRLQPSP